MLGSTDRPRRQAAHLTSRDMLIGDDGTFEILIGGDEQPGNWMALGDETSPFDFGLVVRQYFAGGITDQPASFRVERITGTHGDPRQSDAVARGLREAAGFVADMASYWAAVADDFEPTPNQLVPQAGSRVDGTGANPDNVYFWGLWRLGADEALRIRCDPAPDAELWNFYISNIWWEDIDERSHRMCLNAGNSVIATDGSLEIVVAANDPGFGNHVDTGRYTEGIMLLRQTFPRSIPAITCDVIDIAP
jgi:hypothetical protein